MLYLISWIQKSPLNKRSRRRICIKAVLSFSNDEIINQSIWTSLFCLQFFLKNPCIAELRKYFLRKNGGKRDRPDDGVIVLSLLSMF